MQLLSVDHMWEGRVDRDPPMASCAPAAATEAGLDPTTAINPRVHEWCALDSTVHELRRAQGRCINADPSFRRLLAKVVLGGVEDLEETLHKLRLSALRGLLA